MTTAIAIHSNSRLAVAEIVSVFAGTAKHIRAIIG